MTSRATPLTFFTPFLLILMLQAVMLVTLGYSAFSLSPIEQGNIEHLPPLSFLYGAMDATWIAAGRAIAHAIAGAANVVIAVMCIWYAVGRKIRVIRYITLTIGTQFLVSAAVNICISGLITYGSWWHVAAIVTSMMMAMSAVATVVMFVLAFKHLQKLGLAHDAYVDQLLKGGQHE